jgi:hypothetical protein
MDEKNKKPRWRLNVFDIVIIVVVLAAAAALLLIWRGSGKSTTAVVNTKPVHYTIELTNLENGVGEKIKAGDTIYDSAKKYVMGTVVTVSIGPTVSPVKNLETGDTVMAEVPNAETAIVELVCNAAETDAEIKAESGYIVRGGEKVQAAGPGYAGLGYIVNVARG